ncbi:MAG: pyridoxamine 5'-phosphate oxidase family protein [Alphaproteobacteria bacterium]|nr:pyridoxamine 5'-phosphate oxidase family protein [Alphaproteobacteria bacterium]
MARVTDAARLRALYGAPGERAVRKQLDRLERHSRRFIALSPFLVISSANAAGNADVSPRGGEPGFVHVLDDTRIVLPDWPGNNRIDSLLNLIERPEVGLLFLIPGIRETLRLNGVAHVDDDEALRQRFLTKGKTPRTVMVIEVREVFLHCAKSLMRSALWDQGTWPPRGALPTIGEMLRDQIGGGGEIESEETMLARYREVLY